MGSEKSTMDFSALLGDLEATIKASTGDEVPSELRGVMNAILDAKAGNSITSSTEAVAFDGKSNDIFDYIPSVWREVVGNDKEFANEYIYDMLCSLEALTPTMCKIAGMYFAQGAAIDAIVLAFGEADWKINNVLNLVVIEVSKEFEHRFGKVERIVPITRELPGLSQMMQQKLLRQNVCTVKALCNSRCIYVGCKSVDSLTLDEADLLHDLLDKRHLSSPALTKARNYARTQWRIENERETNPHSIFGYLSVEAYTYLYGYDLTNEFADWLIDQAEWQDQSLKGIARAYFVDCRSERDIAEEYHIRVIDVKRKLREITPNIQYYIVEAYGPTHEAQ